MPKHELEAQLEARCVARVEALGGLALKLVIPGVRGFPDRMILTVEGALFFCEFKRIRTGRVSAQQTKWAELLSACNRRTYFIDTDAQFEAALTRET